MQPGRGFFLFYLLKGEQVLKDTDVTFLEYVNKTEGLDETCHFFPHLGGPASGQHEFLKLDNISAVSLQIGKDLINGPPITLLSQIVLLLRRVRKKDIFKNDRIKSAG